MKKFKQAFTIAELLLCIAIIGIISAMGMTLTRYNVEKAYRSYWQTGYNSLLSIITQSYNDFNDITSDHIIKTCNNILRDIPYDPDSEELNRNPIVASNGIIYNIDIGASTETSIPITMTVPSPKTRKNPKGVSQTRLAYIKINDNDGILIPLAPDDDTQIDLRNSELLKFYIDDGLTGRRVFNTGELVTSDDGKKPIISRTFSDAFCHSSEMQNNLDTIKQFFNPNCDGIDTEDGVIKPMKPRY